MTDPGCRREDRRATETQQSRPGLPNGAGETDMTNGGSEALSSSFRARAGPWLKRLQAGFKENALSYMLVLRLVPLFPFFVVNLVPAFLGVPFRTYLIGTFFGIIPGSLAFTYAGAAGAAALSGTGNRISLIVTAVGAIAVSVFVGRIALRALHKAAA